RARVALLGLLGLAQPVLHLSQARKGTREAGRIPLFAPYLRGHPVALVRLFHAAQTLFEIAITHQRPGYSAVVPFALESLDGFLIVLLGCLAFAESCVQISQSQ